MSLWFTPVSEVAGVHVLKVKLEDTFVTALVRSADVGRPTVGALVYPEPTGTVFFPYVTDYADILLAETLLAPAGVHNRSLTC